MQHAGVHTTCGQNRRDFSAWSIAYFPGKKLSLKTAINQDNASWMEI